MQELVFKNRFLALFLFIVGIVVSSIVSVLKIQYMDIPMPVIILGIAAIFMCYCFVFFPKASTGQTLQLAIAGSMLSLINLAGFHFLSGFLSLPNITLKPDFVLYLSPLALAASLVFSVFAVSVGIRFEEVRQQEEQEEKEELKEEIVQAEEIPVVEEKIEEAPEKEEPPQPEEPQEEFVPFQGLPDGEESQIVLKDEEPNKQEDSEYIDFIPTDIRLVEDVNNKDTEQKGKIGSIGKLLVSNKNIENIIESEEALGEGAQVVSLASGQEMYEKFNKLKETYTCIKEIALVDMGGFVIANDFEDKQKVQVVGALVAGAYLTIQNYLSQLSLGMPVRLLFETGNTNTLLMKTNEGILCSNWDKDFQQVDYGPMAEILEVEDFKNFDITPYEDLLKIQEFAVCNGTAKGTQLFAAVTSAIFENIKVFLMNIKLMKLSRIMIFTPEKTLTIIKPGNSIVSFLTDSADYPKMSEELLKDD